MFGFDDNGRRQRKGLGGGGERGGSGSLERQVEGSTTLTDGFDAGKSLQLARRRETGSWRDKQHFKNHISNITYTLKIIIKSSNSFVFTHRSRNTSDTMNSTVITLTTANNNCYCFTSSSHAATPEECCSSAVNTTGLLLALSYCFCIIVLLL